MDQLRRDTLLAGLTEREIGEVLVMEMRRRGLFGCLIMFGGTEDDREAKGVFVSSSPKNTLADFPMAQQLRFFADVSEHAVEGNRTSLNGEVDTAKPAFRVQ